MQSDLRGEVGTRVKIQLRRFHGRSAYSCSQRQMVTPGTAYLGSFEVESPGPAVVYLSEDALPRVRDRVAQLCRHRGLPLPFKAWTRT